MGQLGKSSRSKAARKGWAGWLMPGHDDTPPFSSRRARDRTAGVCETRANKSLVAEIEASCAKRRETRSRHPRRQALGASGRLAAIVKFVAAGILTCLARSLRERTGRGLQSAGRPLNVQRNERRKRLLLLDQVERNIYRGANPELFVSIVSVKNRPRMETVTDVPLRSRVAEAGLKGIAVFPHGARIIDRRQHSWGREADIVAGDGLQMSVAGIDFPSLDFLEETDRPDELVVPRRLHPAEKQVGIGPKT